MDLKYEGRYDRSGAAFISAALFVYRSKTWLLLARGRFSPAEMIYIRSKTEQVQSL